MAKRDDAQKARARFVDQPGQWKDTTPKSVKQKQEKAWADLFASMNKAKKPAKK